MFACVNVRSKGISGGTVSSTNVTRIHGQEVFSLNMFKASVLLDTNVVTL